MKQYYTPNCPECMGSTDSQSIQNAITKAKETGANKVVIPRINERTNTAEWIVEKAILLPDDIQVVLDNCYMKQAEGIFDNMFRNENFYKNESLVSVQQHNIHITGMGNAVLDGGVHNGLIQEKRRDDEPPIHVNNTIFLHNVDGFSITGIKIVQQRFWAIHVVYSSNGLFRDIDFWCNSDFPNRDGIDIRKGCHDMVIENIRGICEDDVIALSAFHGRLSLQHPAYIIPDRNPDIYNIYIHNIMACSIRYATVAIRNLDGIKLYNVTVDGVTDISDGVNQKPNTIIRFGQKAYARIRPSRVGETSRIFVNNIHVSHGIGIMLNLPLSDSKFSNIFCGPESSSAVSTSARSRYFKPGGTLRNVEFDGIYVDPENKSEDPVLEFLIADNFETTNLFYKTMPFDEKDFFENVTFRNFHPGRTENVVVSEYDGGFTIE